MSSLMCEQKMDPKKPRYGR